MTYQGRKCIELARLMRKKSAIDEESLVKSYRRGTTKAGKKARYIKRHNRKILQELRITEATTICETEAPVIDSESEMYSPDSVINFMGGVSYNVSPLETLKMISASSIFGEPQYYRD